MSRDFQHCSLKYTGVTFSPVSVPNMFFMYKLVVWLNENASNFFLFCDIFGKHCTLCAECFICCPSRYGKSARIPILKVFEPLLVYLMLEPEMQA